MIAYWGMVLRIEHMGAQSVSVVVRDEWRLCLGRGRRESISVAMVNVAHSGFVCPALPLGVLTVEAEGSDGTAAVGQLVAKLMSQGVLVQEIVRPGEKTSSERADRVRNDVNVALNEAGRPTEGWFRATRARIDKAMGKKDE